MTDNSLFLFIIWEKARSYTDNIMNDLNEKLIINEYESEFTFKKPDNK